MSPRPARRARILCAALLLALAGAPAAARAQAFLHWEQSARGLGMGGAAAAVADDPSAAFYNPGGIVRFPGTQVQIGGMLSGRSASFDAFGAPDADADTRYGALPSLFATHAIAAYWTGGFSFTEPWRAELGWNDGADFVGRFRATESRLSAYSFDPVLAWHPLGRVGVAAGIAIVEASFLLERFEHDPVISAMAGGGPVELARSSLDLEATSIGWTAGAHWRARDDLSVGLQYRSRISVEFNGDVDFTIVASDSVRDLRFPSGERVGTLLDQRYVDQQARSRFVFPAIATGGVAWHPVEPVLLTLDLQWAGWGEMDDVTLSFADTLLGDVTPLDYDDTWSLRVGAEARPGGPLAVRVGFARVWSPAPFSAVGPLLPDADRSSISLGAGTRWRDIDFDAAYRLTVLEDREGVAFPLNDTSPDGIYESAEHAFAIAATRRF